MAYSEFYVQPTGSNLNAGSTTSDNPLVTYLAGTWTGTASNNTFTPVSGNPIADGVTVGMFASVYADGDGSAFRVARVIAVSSTVITMSSSVASGGTIANGTSQTMNLRIGGAWKGPGGGGLYSFPINFITGSLVNVNSDSTRVNFKGTWNITQAMTQSTSGGATFAGYSTTPGDNGFATFDGGTTGASFTILNSNSATSFNLENFIFQNNGATGSAAGVTFSNDRGGYRNIVIRNMRGAGLMMGASKPLERFEIYNCNLSNTANTGAVTNSSSTGVLMVDCFIHDNLGTNTDGVYTPAINSLFTRCTFHNNGRDGINLAGGRNALIDSCNFYNNVRNGISGGVHLSVRNSNFLKNGGYGITTANRGWIENCGFGSGTMANTSGSLSDSTMSESGTINYATDVSPWVNADNGDFRINLAAAKGTGIGTFLQMKPNYSGTVSYPDIGGVQHQDTGGGGGTTVISIPVYKL